MERAVYLRKSFSCWKERALSGPIIFEKDVAIPMRDGAVLRANVYRPNTSERFPVILTVGPYGKDLHFEEFDPGAYAQIDEHGPSLNWETPNPDWWIPRGYVVSVTVLKWLIPLFGESVGKLEKSATLASVFLRRGGKGCQQVHCFHYRRA
jgi:hypothetical protein